MADNPIQRPFRASNGPGRHASPGPASSSVNDPLAELARLIGQDDPFGEFGRDRWRREAPPAAPAPVPGYPPPPAEDLYRAEASVPGYDSPAAEDDEAYDHDPYDANLASLPPEDEDYYDDVPPRRRMGILAVAAVFALAVIGTAGAFGYRALFGSVSSGPPPVIKADTTPSKIVPDSKKNAQAKLINDRVGETAGEKLVSREEQPIDLPDKPVGMLTQSSASPTSPAAAPAGSVQPPAPGSGIIAGTEPKAVHTITIRPDRPMVASAGATAIPNLPSAPETTSMPAAEPTPVAPQPARAPEPAAQPDPPARHTASAPHRASPASNAPLSLSPNAATPAPAAAAPPPARTAAARSDAAAAGGYAVQISSRRNEADAEAAFRTLQAKFPGQLGGHQPLIRRVDLGEKGVYYRAMVGPFGNADEASKLCSDLKAAGGSCFVQRI
jgi:hypothetical protein